MFTLVSSVSAQSLSQQAAATAMTALWTEYYLSEKVVTNDPKGIGAFLLAATEIYNKNRK